MRPVEEEQIVSEETGLEDLINLEEEKLGFDERGSGLKSGGCLTAVSVKRDEHETKCGSHTLRKARQHRIDCQRASGTHSLPLVS